MQIFIYSVAAIAVIAFALIVYAAIRAIREKRYAAACALIVLGAVPATQFGVFVTKRAMADHEWGFRKSLPKGTVEICEWRFADGFLPDYTYYLKAQVSKSDAEAYIRGLGLSRHSPDRKYNGQFTGPDWRSGGPDPWWNPTPDLSDTYVDQPHEQNWTFAKYEGEYLYLHSYCH